MKLTKKTRGLYHIWVKSYKSFQTPRKKKNVLYFIRPLYTGVVASVKSSSGVTNVKDSKNEDVNSLMVES